MNSFAEKGSEASAMGPEYPIYCPICGDTGVHDPSTFNLSSRTIVFQYFLKFFRAKWRGKTFSFCEECKAQLLLISHLRTQLKQLKRRVRDQENGLESKMICSEVKFERSNLYGRDKRYFKLRRQILGDRVLQPKLQASDLLNGRKIPPLPQPQQSEILIKFMKIEMDEEEPEREINLPHNATSPGFDDYEDVQESFNEQAQHQANSQSAEDKEKSEIEEEEAEAPPKPATRQRQQVEEQQQRRRSTRIIKKRKVISSESEESESNESSSEEEQQHGDDDENENEDGDEVDVPNEDKKTSNKRKGRAKPGKRAGKGKKVIDKSVITIHDCELRLLPEENKYKCSKCSSILPNLARIYRYHVVKEHTQIYACQKCFKRFGKASHLQRHLETIHPTDAVSASSQHQCPICCRPFSRADAIKGHLWTHYSEQEKQDALARGEKAPFRVGKRFHCEICGSSFSTTTWLAQHQKLKHGPGNVEGDKVLCGICGSTVMNLKKHMLVKHTAYQDRKWECGICKKKFVHSSGLKHHRKVAHETEKEWNCDLCDMKFKFEKNMQEHRLGHGAVKPFGCHLCGMGFSRYHVLKRHVASIHEGKVRKDSKKYQYQQEDLKEEENRILFHNYLHSSQ